MLPRTRHRLAGPPFALPPVLDRAADRWWAARPRTRTLAGCALAVLLVVAGVAHAASSPGGPPTTVWTTTRDLTPGETLTEQDVRARSWPTDLVPAGAVDRPTGTVTAALPQGAVVTDRHLGDLGIVSALPDGHVGVAIPAEQLPVLAPGTGLQLVGPGPDGGGALLASAARVVAYDGEVVWVAIDPDDALGVSAAVASATIAAVVVPGHLGSAEGSGAATS